MAETLRRGAARLANVRGLADAGFFLDHANISGAPRIRSEFQYLFAMANVSGSTNAACAAAHARDAPADAWRCFMAQYVLDYVRTPVFLAEGKYDSWQLNNVLQLGCGSPTPETTCGAARLQAFFAYGDAMAAAVGAALAKHPDAGAFFFGVHRALPDRVQRGAGPVARVARGRAHAGRGVRELFLRGARARGPADARGGHRGVPGQPELPRVDLRVLLGSIARGADEARDDRSREKRG